jgi:peptidoglycan hydrolase-like protein with peptidoglycan-binding domain
MRRGILHRSVLAGSALAAAVGVLLYMVATQADGPVKDMPTLASADRQPADSAAVYREQMKLAQETLRSFGYTPGAIDGIMRFETASALRAFQREKGLTITGQANPEALAALGIEDRLYRRPR